MTPPSHTAGYQEIVALYRNAFPDIKLAIEEQIAEGVDFGDELVTSFMSRTSGNEKGVPPQENWLI